MDTLILCTVTLDEIHMNCQLIHVLAVLQFIKVDQFFLSYIAYKYLIHTDVVKCVHE